MSKTVNKLVQGAAILGIAGIVIKGLGAFFRIPLTNWIGDTGMAYYGVAYTIYGVLLVLSTAGVPVAISRLVSENIAVGRYRNAHKIFKISIRILFAIGLSSFALCFFLGDEIALLVGNKDASLPLKAISPALLIVPIFAAFRGYFQGKQNMMPTAISEITEQAARVVVGLVLAYLLIPRGLVYSAAGASFGASAGAVFGLISIVVIYFFNREKIYSLIDRNCYYVDSTKSIIKKIIIISVPIVIGSEIMPMMNVIDTGLIMNRLQATGWTTIESTSMYGLLTGFCNSLIAFPQVFTQAVAVCLVPIIASSYETNDDKSVRKNITLGYRISMIMAFPCAFGIFALAEPILFLLYPDQRASSSAAVSTLLIMSVNIVFLSICQTSTGVLQSIGKQSLPVKHLIFGCFVKLGMTYALVGISSVNIKGAALGSMGAYLIALILNNRSVKLYTDVKFDYFLIYIKPAISAIIMAICVYCMNLCLALFLDNRISVVLSIFFGCAIYLELIIRFKVLTSEEIALLNSRRKRLHIFGKE